MLASLVAETKWDVELIRRILPADLVQEIAFYTGEGLAGVQSYARSLVSTQPWPVVVIIDADSSDPAIIQECRETITEVIGSVAGRVPFKIIIAEPQLEVILFQSPTTLLRLYPELEQKSYVFEVAKENTQMAFKLLNQTFTFAQFQDQLLSSINDDDLVLLRQIKVMVELIEFLESCRAHRVLLRIEIGPGVPFNRHSLQAGDGFKALLTVLTEMLTSKGVSGPQSATCGNKKVEFTHRHFNAGSVEPAGTLPSTFFLTLEGIATIEEIEKRSE